MQDFHQYIYDVENRVIVGDFEGAYRNCDDVWPGQHDITTLKFRLVEQMATARPGGSLLDIGCGYGDFVAHLARQGVNACGCDISPAAIEKGRKIHGEHVQLCAADVKSGLPYQNEEFDIVILMGVFWFVLDSADAALAEIERVLKPGGWFVVSLFIPENPIGKEIIGCDDDFARVIGRRFTVEQTMKAADRGDLESGQTMSACRQDTILFCRKENARS